jgi:hypothetical protein
MKGKPIRGRGFGGGLRYTFRVGAKANHSEQRPRIVGGNMAGRTAEELTREFGAVRRLRPDIEQPVWHCPLSLTKGETITDEIWDQFTRDLMIELEFDPDIFPYVLILHDDEYQHSHLWANRIGVDGSVWHGKWEAFKVIEACQRLEKKYGLVLTQGLHRKDDEAAKAKRNPRTADAQSILNANKVRGTRKIDTAECARVLFDCAARSRDLPTFAQAALVVGFTVKPNRSETTGRISGLSIVPTGRKKFLPLGDATGRKLTWPKLLKLFEQNDAAADAAQLAARDVVAAADQRATRLVDARLARQADTSTDPESKPEAIAILPSLVEKDAQAMARHLVDPNDRLGFLAEPPPSRPIGRLDDADLGEGANARREREQRDRDAAELALTAELKTASKKDLGLARRALLSELAAADSDYIERFVARLTRLVVRVVTAGAVVLPATAAERRVLVAQHTVACIDGELRRRADVSAVAGRDADQRTTLALLLDRMPAAAVQRLQIVRPHDARQLPPTPAHREQDERDQLARKLDAERERNRS